MKQNTLVCAAAFAALVLAGCGKQEPQQLSDAEAIQKIGQAVLAAPDKKARAAEHREAAAAWAAVDEKLAALQADLMSASAGQVTIDSGPDGKPGQGPRFEPASEEKRAQRLDELVDVLERLRGIRAAADAAASVPAEWREQFRAAALARMDALLDEVRGLRGRDVPTQLAAVTELQARVSNRSLTRDQPAQIHPTLVVDTVHR
jgi:hypothetical protein